VDVAALDQLREQARLTLTEAREAVVGMRASGDALVPLSARLANAARRVFAETDVDVRLVVTGPQRRHGQALEEEVLRIAMEAMTNARDHAHGRTVTVTCAYGERELCVRVRDDGRGFDPARAMANGHFGMAGMRERAASIGARLTVTSAPGRGTDVLLVVGPLQRVMSADAAW
jgi:signal transduction histidine kinase